MPIDKRMIDMLEECEVRAKDGSPGFAIAFALLKLVEYHRELVLAVDDLGFGRRSSATAQGAFEGHTVRMQDAMNDVTRGLMAIAEAIGEHK